MLWWAEREGNAFPGVSAWCSGHVLACSWEIPTRAFATTVFFGVNITVYMQPSQSLRLSMDTQPKVKSRWASQKRAATSG